MRKTTEELANECVSELKDNQFDLNNLDAADKQMLFKWFETFRRLVIENERECATPFCYMTESEEVVHGMFKTDPDVFPVFRFPPAAQGPEVDYFKCQKVADEHGLDYNKFCAAFRAMLTAAPDKRDLASYEENKDLIREQENTIAQQAYEIQRFVDLVELSEDSRLMDEYIKLDNDHKRLAERIKELEAESEEYAQLQSRCFEGYASCSDGIFDFVKQQAKLLAYWQADSTAALDKCEEQRLENARLKGIIEASEKAEGFANAKMEEAKTTCGYFLGNSNLYFVESLRAENAELREQLAAAERDAGRYREARRLLSACMLDYYSIEGLSETEIDKEIDEQIAASREGKS